jgi:hypothetical protein
VKIGKLLTGSIGAAADSLLGVRPRSASMACTLRRMLSRTPEVLSEAWAVGLASRLCGRDVNKIVEDTKGQRKRMPIWPKVMAVMVVCTLLALLQHCRLQHCKFNARDQRVPSRQCTARSAAAHSEDHESKFTYCGDACSKECGVASRAAGDEVAEHGDDCCASK